MVVDLLRVSLLTKEGSLRDCTMYVTRLTRKLGSEKCADPKELPGLSICLYQKACNACMTVVQRGRSTFGHKCPISVIQDRTSEIEHSMSNLGRPISGCPNSDHSYLETLEKLLSSALRTRNMYKTKKPHPLWEGPNDDTADLTFYLDLQF